MVVIEETLSLASPSLQLMFLGQSFRLYAILPKW